MNIPVRSTLRNPPTVAPSHFVREYVYLVQPRKLYAKPFRAMTEPDRADLEAAIKVAQTAWLSRVRACDAVALAEPY